LAQENPEDSHGGKRRSHHLRSCPLDDVKETVSHPAASTAGILIQTREATITIRDGASPETIQAVLKVMTASC